MPDRIDPLHEQGTHHWILTLDGVGSRSGTCDWELGETRYDLYLRIRSAVIDEADLADQPTPVTIFFDVRPNLHREKSIMRVVKKVAEDVRVVVRYLATGRTRSRKDMAALRDYQRYQAAEQARERDEYGR